MEKPLLISNTNNTKSSAIELEIKFKMLYLAQSEQVKLKNRKNNIQIFLKIIFSIYFKTVFSSKNNNRILKNYFKIYGINLDTEYEYTFRTNKPTVDPNYTNSLSINNLYEFVSALGLKK